MFSFRNSFANLKWFEPKNPLLAEKGEGCADIISLDDDSIFEGLPNEITVGRYHSLSLLEDTLPDSLKIISKSNDDGEVMAVKHKEFDVYGLQFHPESILTPDGLTIMEHFLNRL